MFSEDFELLQKTLDFFRESSEKIVSFSKIPALSGYKSYAYISEKVGRYKTVVSINIMFVVT